MIDESLLDAPDALDRADLRGLLRSVAASGAQVRTALRAVQESPVPRLQPDGRPGTVLVAGPGPDTALTAGLLSALIDENVRVARLPATGALAAPGALRWPLPHWAGALDLLLITSTDGSEPGLGELLETAYRRGLTVVTVAPDRSSLSDLTLRRRSLTIELTHAPRVELPAHPAAPGPQWSLVTPLLYLCGRLGLCAAGEDALLALADRLDATAERCGPAVPVDANPAKALAAEFAGSLPLLWSDGLLASAAARHGAATLTGLSGLPALSADLPEAMTAHGALLGGSLTGGPEADDFFRDRVEEPPALHARVVLLRSPAVLEPPGSNFGNGGGAERPERPGRQAGTRFSAADAARELAVEQGAALSELTPTDLSTPLEAAAELIAQLDFTAVYLALTSSNRS
ncbi:SIS domain-containing protein [Streptomyces sp. YIM 98790]|uniref:SIS domain-containing protein n=1 Tax=Streptomyces sp. YIM 98790 TaxID=2689077 RepID=UPI00140DFBD2|nr:SIS domain-containing protein [Streptomyces sp. YIM 98790]